MEARPKFWKVSTKHCAASTFLTIMALYTTVNSTQSFRSLRDAGLVWVCFRLPLPRETLLAPADTSVLRTRRSSSSRSSGNSRTRSTSGRFSQCPQRCQDLKQYHVAHRVPAHCHQQTSCVECHKRGGLVCGVLLRTSTAHP